MSHTHILRPPFFLPNSVYKKAKSGKPKLNAQKTYAFSDWEPFIKFPACQSFSSS